jgi:hypothetical protein
VRGGAHPYQEQLFSEPFNQRSRSLKLRELPAVVHIPSTPDAGGLTQMRIATRAEIAHLQFHL